MRISDWSSDVCSSDLATRCECLDRPQWCRQIARSASDREGLDDAIEDGRHRLHEEAEPEPSGGRLLQSVRAVFGGPEGRATSGPRRLPLLWISGTQAANQIGSPRPNPVVPCIPKEECRVSAERRVGQECVSKGRTRWAPQ